MQYLTQDQVRRRYQIVDGPLDDARAVWRSNNLGDAKRMVDSLNRINLKQDGPWGYGRYWIDDGEAVCNI